MGDGGKPLFVGRYELLWHEYYQSVVEAGCPPPANSDGTVLDYDPGREDRYPITSIKPIYIECYLKWLRAKTGKAYRLPYEREWKKIASASGVADEDTVGNYPERKAFLRNEYETIPSNFYDRRRVVKLRVIAPVGGKLGDKIGLYDLVGNLSEMTMDLPENAKTKFPKHSAIALKGGGLASQESNSKILSGFEITYSKANNSFVGYRVIRED